MSSSLSGCGLRRNGVERKGRDEWKCGLPLIISSSKSVGGVEGGRRGGIVVVRPSIGWVGTVGGFAPVKKRKYLIRNSCPYSNILISYHISLLTLSLSS